MSVKRPNIVKVFAGNAQQGDYLPIKFGTNVVVPKGALEAIANANFEFGLESLEKDLQLKDLNSVFYYNSALIQYLYQHGIPEFSAYEDYVTGSVVQYNGDVWIATKDFKASLSEDKKLDPCNPCAMPVCQTPEYPSKDNGWCKFITSCEYDSKIKELEAMDNALDKAIKNLKGVTDFSITTNTETNTKELSLTLSDGSILNIPMSKFGMVTKQEDNSYKVVNADGSELTIPAHKASVKVTNTNGEFTFGYFHLENEKVGEPTSTVHLIESNDLDYNKGFYYDPATKKVRVDLADLVKSDSGLLVDKEGNIYIDPNYAKNLIATLDERGAKVYSNSPISGTGEKTNPLTIKLGYGLETDSDGNLVVITNKPITMTNMNSGYKQGLSVVSGLMGESEHNPQNYIKGFPKNIDSDEKEQDMSSSISDVTTNPPNTYDWSGIVVATDNQVTFQMTGVTGTAWQIVNDSGIDSNGNIKDPTAWGKWQKLDNSSNLTDTMLKALQDLVASLQARVTTLENNVVPVYDASGKTIQFYAAKGV